MSCVFCDKVRPSAVKRREPRPLEMYPGLKCDARRVTTYGQLLHQESRDLNTSSSSQHTAHAAQLTFYWLYNHLIDSQRQMVQRADFFGTCGVNNANIRTPICLYWYRGFNFHIEMITHLFRTKYAVYLKTGISIFVICFENLSQHYG